MKAYRASILRFNPDLPADHSAVFEEDGLLVVEPGEFGNKSHKSTQGVAKVHAVGPYASLMGQFAHLPVEDLSGRIIAPGFVDMHLHYPQTDVIGSPAEGLLPWLTNYTFPEESRFASADYSAQAADFFVAELVRHGVTTALTFATSHVASVNALFAAAQGARLRMISGKCLQDRNSPDGVRDMPHPSGRFDATEQSLIDTEALIQQWHGKGRAGYAITPRFAPSCSDAQLRGAGELAAKYPDVWIQSHVAENQAEIDWARQLFPQSRSYLVTYADFGLMRRKAVYAHCIHFDDADRELMRHSGAVAAVCPTSNLFLGSGFFDFAAADRAGFQYGLASDVGGGTSFSPFHTMLAAYYVGRASWDAELDESGKSDKAGESGKTGKAGKAGISLSPQNLWWQHTAGAAQALGLGGVAGNLQVGCDADFVVLNPKATPLLARKTARAQNLDELLFSMIVLGDDRLIERTLLA